MSEAGLTIVAKDGEHHVRVLYLRGDVTELTHGALETRVEDEIKSGHVRVVIDGSGLGLISGMGAGKLIQLVHRLRKRRGDIRLAGLNATLVGMLRAMRLDRMLGLYPDVEAAVDSYASEMWM